jgi:hypothetical protein
MESSFPKFVQLCRLNVFRYFKRDNFKEILVLDTQNGHKGINQTNMVDVPTLVFAFFTQNDVQKVPYGKEHYTFSASDAVFFDCSAINISEL